MTAPPRIALALGDPGGISYAVTARALRDFSGAEVRLFGDLAHYQRTRERVQATGGESPAGENLPGAGHYAAKPDAENGRVALASLEAALAAVRRGEADI